MRFQHSGIDQRNSISMEDWFKSHSLFCFKNFRFLLGVIFDTKNNDAVSFLGNSVMFRTDNKIMRIRS